MRQQRKRAGGRSRVEQSSLLDAEPVSLPPGFDVYRMGAAGQSDSATPATATIGAARVADTLQVEVMDYRNPLVTSALAAAGSADGSDWRAVVDAVLIDPAYDGETFRIALADVPERRADLVAGLHTLPAPSGPATVAVKIVDVLGTETIITQPLTDW